MKERIILHIDFDSFFASVEQQYNPHLRGKPIGVTATNGRTCIIAASREAKRYGIKTGTRSWEAQKRYPHIIFVPADFSKYFVISKKFLSICKDYSPFVELFSIDEVFIDITQTTHLFGGTEAIVKRIKQRIHDEIGASITVSAGISHNKLLAKLASGLEKPNGCTKITSDDIAYIYKKAKLTDICGIGNRIAQRLNNAGIHTLSELQQASLAFLIAVFGQAEGRFLYNVGKGIDTTPIIPYTEKPKVKSVSRNYCLPHNEYNQRIVLQTIYELAEEVGLKLRRLGKKARTVGLSLRGNRSTHGRLTTTIPFSRGSDIFTLCKKLYDTWGYGKSNYKQDDMVRMISVWTGNLSDSHHTPLSLFSDTIKQTKLLETIDTINERFGDHTIRNGFLLYADKLTTVPNGWMADRHERTNLAKKSQ